MIQFHTFTHSHLVRIVQFSERPSHWVNSEYEFTYKIESMVCLCMCAFTTHNSLSRWCDRITNSAHMWIYRLLPLGHRRLFMHEIRRTNGEYTFCIFHKIAKHKIINGKWTTFRLFFFSDSIRFASIRWANRIERTNIQMHRRTLSAPAPHSL